MMETVDPSHEGRDSRGDEDEDWNGSDKRKRKSSSKLMPHSSRNVEDNDQETGKRRSSGEKDDGRRKSGISTHGDSSDEEDYDGRRDSRSKSLKKNSVDRSEKRSGDGYRERESGSSRKSKGEERERSRKTSGKTSGHDSSQNRNKKKPDASHGSELERESRHSEQKESHRERNHSSHEEEKGHSRRRNDETDSAYADRSESRGGKSSDHHKPVSSRSDLGDFTADRRDKAGNRVERTRSVEDLEPGSHKISSKSHSEKSEKHKQHRSRDDVDFHEKSPNVDDYGHERSRDKGVRDSKESKHSRRSHTPDIKHYKDSDDVDRGLSDSDNEKKRGRDDHRDGQSTKGKDGYKDDRNRDREVSKDHSRRSHSSRHDRDNKDREVDYDYDGNKYQSRSSQSKSTKTSSVVASLNEHSDMIEIRPNKNLDFGREGSVSNPLGRRSEGGVLLDFPSGGSDEEWAENRSKSSLGQGDDTQERYGDEGSLDIQGPRGRGQKGVQVVGHSSQLPFGNNQGTGSVNRPVQQGAKMGRPMRGGRGRVPVRDVPRGGMQLPMLGPPFGHLMQPIGPNMSPSPGPQIGPGVFLPGFPPVVWQGVPPALSPLPSGLRFPPGIPAGPNHGMYFNQPGAGRGLPLNTPSPDFNAFGPMIRGLSNDKVPGGWNPLRISGPPGKAPSRGEQNDYSQNFVDTGMRPQNFIRELELTSVVEDYPKLRELIQKKDEIVAKSATPPMYYKCDLREFVLSSEFFGTKFDVVLVDPPWEEYAHRAPGVVDHMESWSFEEIQNLKIEAIADTPSFIFLWVGDGVGLEQGRQCLKKWGFRRCEDICWVKTNKTNAAPSLRHDSRTLFQHSKEHCLMGIKGTVRRSTDGHIIHANIDTDVIIAEEPSYGSTMKPEDLYRIIEHFSLGRRRLELFGGDHNIRSGWLTLGKDLSSSNFNKESYCKNFADKDGKVWQGGGGRNPPLDAPHLVVTTPDIESLRPKSPPQKNQQVQTSSLSTPVSSTKRMTVNSPQNPSSVSPLLGLNPEVSGPGPNPPLLPWVSPPIVGSFKAVEASSSSAGGLPDEKFFVPPPIPPTVEALDFDPQAPVNF